MSTRAVAAVIALCLAPLAAEADEAEPLARHGDIVVEDGWARASLAHVPNSAAYVTLTNEGARSDRLVDATSSAAERVELHAHLHEDGVVRMRRIEAIEITPGEPTVLRPGGLHVMLFGLTAPLLEGTRLPLELHFAEAGTIVLELPVRGLDHRPPDARGHHGH